MGSLGPDVRLLQQALNLAKPKQPLLADDGMFGPKTRGRVLEFQAVEKLAVDGVVGDQTHGALTAAYQKLAELIKKYMPPPEITALRQRIVQIARTEQQVFGWPLGGAGGQPGYAVATANLPPLGSPRIAALYLADKATRARQGGPKLAFIFGAVGAITEHVERCWRIKDGYCVGENEITYEQYKAVRNEHDLPSWCGMFALFVYRSAGVMLPNWTANPFEEGANMKQVKANDVAPGDLGKLEPFGGRNHHFIITDVIRQNLGGKDVVVGVKSIDGNDGSYQSIVTQTRQVGAALGNGLYQVGGKVGVFMSPVILHQHDPPA
ncbi:MAG: peptidoglycan-binding domain-containing protein [Pirellulales bacterium]